MKVKTFVVKVKDYETALATLDERVNNFLIEYRNEHGDIAIQDTLYPPIKPGDYSILARRFVYKVVYR
jgi:hypothetical protein